MNDSLEDLYQCIGYCQVDDAGYCLGCGRPTRAVAAPRTSATESWGGRMYDDMRDPKRDEMPLVDAASADNRFPVDSLTQ